MEKSWWYQLQLSGDNVVQINPEFLWTLPYVLSRTSRYTSCTNHGYICSRISWKSTPLPHIVEKWVSTQSGLCRVVLCLSQYGIHWEIGALQSGVVQPTHIFSGEQNEDARHLLAQYFDAPVV